MRSAQIFHENVFDFCIFSSVVLSVFSELLLGVAGFANCENIAWLMEISFRRVSGEGRPPGSLRWITGDSGGCCCLRAASGEPIGLRRCKTGELGDCLRTEHGEQMGGCLRDELGELVNGFEGRI